ncbi:MAG: DNA (cytosine-5)-methyltransferase 1 [Cocleimonas sp.]|jgi:DNA (cytosine-5)-methyltransferase 1
MKLKVIDLFCGAGGMSGGLKLCSAEGHVKFTHVLAIDNDKDAIATYNKNFSDTGICVDIEKWLEESEVPETDIVIGGPPCQGFSLLNRNRTGDKRRDLWEPYMDIVERSNAKAFIMENVQGLLKSQEFLDIKKRAESLGFSLQYDLINMANHGIAQTRKRAIIIGLKKDCFTGISKLNFHPEPTHNDPKLGFLLPSWCDVKSVIGDLPEPKGTEIRNDEPPLNLHFGRNPTELSMKRYKIVPPGGNRFDLQKNAPEITPKCWLNKPSGGTDLFGRLWWDRPSVTIRTEFFKPEKGRYLHPEQHRPITHREAARIMSFPDSFEFVGSKTSIARQIGNAVPPKFACQLAYSIGIIFKKYAI